MRHMLNICKFMFVILLLAGTKAGAQDRLDNQGASAASAAQVALEKAKADLAANPPGAFFEKISSVAKTMANQNNASLAGSLFEEAIKISKKANDWAPGIAGSLLLVYLIVETINYMGGKNNSLAGVLFDAAIPAAFCAYLLVEYEKLIRQLAEPGAGEKSLLEFVRNIGGDPIAALMGMYSAILQMVATTIGQALSNWGMSALTSGLGGIFLGFAHTLVTLLLALVMIYILIGGIAEVVGLVLMGPFLCAVAVALGPIFIAGFATPWTREYFSKWLGFLIASAVLSGVIGVCISIATGLFSSFGFNDYTGSYTPTATSLLVAIVVVMSINSLIKQAPSIATALVPGGFGASKGAGGDMNNAVKGAAEKAAAIAKETSRIKGAAK